MPVGSYSVHAEIWGEGGHEIASARSNVNVVAGGGY
jgi:hypothetical protein